jgi:hypothetical protein
MEIVFMKREVVSQPEGGKLSRKWTELVWECPKRVLESIFSDSNRRDRMCMQMPNVVSCLFECSLITFGFHCFKF